MYEFIKDINDNVKLAYSDGNVYIAKEITPDDMQVYRKLSEIKNENIVSPKEIIPVDGRFYVIRDYIQGVTLDKYIEQNGLMDDETVRKVIIDVCNGLRAVHGLGIVHRDINPSNIIIDSNGKAVIIDFGISRISKSGRSRDTQILGTQGYAAPEQYGFSQTDNRADIYAVGVLINYLKTGKMPNEKLESGRFRRMIIRCIEIDSEDRYPSVEKIMRELGARVKGGNIDFTPPGFRKNVTWHKAVAVIYAVLFVGLCLLLLWDTESFVKGAFCFFELFFMFALPVPLLTNWIGWVDRLPGSKFRSTKEKTGILVIAAGISEIISLTLIILEQSV